MTTDNTPVTRDYRLLVQPDRLSNWTADRQREHGADQAEYEQVLAAFQTYLRQQHVEGDGRWSARWRARKVEKHIKKLAKASKQAAGAAEGLRTSYAEHQRVVAALPGQRAAKAARKGKSGPAEIDKGLNKAAPAAPPVQTARPAGQMPPGGVLAQPPKPVAETLRGINELWQRKGA
ncbi:hypothetical protein [Kitasatospora sp. HPMI-4]|uniref:hypothetical protein n=1 Tax=Kitasatospora sp. HPMI-4 TaxID=3448443 RepID=UPI003F1C2AE3